MRRRRAAKLQNFFGVDYKDLIHDVVESIEKGVEEDGKRGTLNADELQVHIFVVPMTLDSNWYSRARIWRTGFEHLRRSEVLVYGRLIVTNEYGMDGPLDTNLQCEDVCILNAYVAITIPNAIWKLQNH